MTELTTELQRKQSGNKRLHLRSLIEMILIGTLIVIAPLLLAIVFATYTFEELSNRQRGLVQEVVQVTRSSVAVRDLLIDMERSARQFQLLHNSEFRILFEQQYSQFTNALGHLDSILPSSMKQHFSLPLQDRMQNINALLEDGEITSEQRKQAINDAFGFAIPLAVQLSKSARKWVDDEVVNLESELAEKRSFVLLLSILMIPTTALLIILFLQKVSRPLHQLSDAIQGLGQGRFDAAIEVSGPRDFKDLGESLEWLRKRLQILEEDKKRFIRHISHELKTPLASIHEGSELLKDRVPGELNSAQEEVVDIVRDNTKLLQALIEKLLNFNALLLNSKLEYEPIEIKGFINEIANNHKLLARNKKLNWEIIGPSITMMADRIKLHGALDNLISNAINFSPQQGTITIRWKKSPEGWQIEVIDDGPGVDTEDQRKIFEPFVQGKNRRQGPVKGTGIGLSICLESVRALGGSIFLNNYQHRGAQFIIQLPVKDELSNHV